MSARILLDCTANPKCWKNDGHEGYCTDAENHRLQPTDLDNLTSTNDVKLSEPPSETGAVAQLTQAQRMLAQARDVADFRDLRDYSTTMRAWARSRGLGVESENQAAEFILRAERGAGKELARMAEAGERSGRGWPKGVPHDEHGRVPVGPGLWEKAVRLPDLGISHQDASYWMALAAMQDDAFDEAIARALKPGPDGRVHRLSKMSIYRLSKMPASRGPNHSDAPLKNDPVAPFEMLRSEIVGFLAAGINRLSPDDVVGLGKLGIRLVKAARAEMDRRGL